MIIFYLTWIIILTFFIIIYAQFENIKKRKQKNPLLSSYRLSSVGNINRKKFTSLLSKKNNCCH